MHKRAEKGNYKQEKEQGEETEQEEEETNEEKGGLFHLPPFVSRRVSEQSDAIIRRRDKANRRPSAAKQVFANH